jgi:hypothetical protein
MAQNYLPQNYSVQPTSQSVSNFSNFFSLNNIVISLGVFLLVFFILREVLTWYWKINEVITLLKQIKHNTSKDVDGSSQSIVQNTGFTEKEIGANAGSSFKNFFQNNKNLPIILIIGLIIIGIAVIIKWVFKIY